MKPLLLKLLLILAALYLGICLLLFIFQRSLLYAPTPSPRVPPDSLATLEVEGAVLNISVRLLQGPDALIYFGGNAQDVSGRLDAFAETFPDHSIYMMHYRGFGGSTGSPSEEAIHADARELFEMVHAKHNNIVVVGRSLGSSVAVRIAATQPVSRLILVTPFDSILNIVKPGYPFIPTGLLLKDKYESWRDAPRVKAPTLIVIAEEDRIIPRERSLALVEAFSEGVTKTVFITDVGHNSITSSPHYMPALKDGI